jgi:thiosulfate reductase cytochrome b subunit
MTDTTGLQAHRGPLIYRQSIWTRVTHWVWAICLFFLLLTGLQIFNAHPTLYIGQQSGFEFDNAILSIGAVNSDAGPRGQTTVLGHAVDTTGVLGVSGTAERPVFTAFPGAVTIPSYRDLGTGRVVHFFFGWIFVATMLIWFVASFVNGHIKRDIVPRGADIRGVPRDVADHATLKFKHGRTYGPLQKLSYFSVFFILFPLIVLTGLTMSPGMNAFAPWLLDLFGGRQTARTIHFITMAVLVAFFVIHIIMVVAAGPINELRSMITGWYRASPGTPAAQGDKP